MTPLTIVIPAAGASARMRGGDKLMEQVDGQPMLRRQAGVALMTRRPVMITLRPTDTARQAALEGLAVRILEVPDAASGMSASLRRAAGALGTALMILPADMPDLTAQDLTALIAAWEQAPDLIHRGSTEGGQPGHPVIFPARFLPDLTGLAGDEGARPIVARTPALLVPLPGRHAVTDLDTPEDWAAWRAQR